MSLVSGIRHILNVLVITHSSTCSFNNINDILNFRYVRNISKIEYNNVVVIESQFYSLGAESRAVLEGIHRASRLGLKEVVVFSDSLTNI